MPRTVGAFLIFMGALIAGVLFVLSITPSSWRRTHGVVAMTDGVRAVVKYEADGSAYDAYLNLPGSETGQRVGLVYSRNSPGVYDHAGIRWATLLAGGVPIASALTVCGAAIAFAS